MTGTRHHTLSLRHGHSKAAIDLELVLDMSGSSDRRKKFDFGFVRASSSVVAALFWRWSFSIVLVGQHVELRPPRVAFATTNVDPNNVGPTGVPTEQDYACIFECAERENFASRVPETTDTARLYGWNSSWKEPLRGQTTAESLRNCWNPFYRAECCDSGALALSYCYENKYQGCRDNATERTFPVSHLTASCGFEPEGVRENVDVEVQLQLVATHPREELSVVHLRKFFDALGLVVSRNSSTSSSTTGATSGSSTTSPTSSFLTLREDADYCSLGKTHVDCLRLGCQWLDGGDGVPYAQTFRRWTPLNRCRPCLDDPFLLHAEPWSAVPGFNCYGDPANACTCVKNQHPGLCSTNQHMQVACPRTCAAEVAGASGAVLALASTVMCSVVNASSVVRGLVGTAKGGGGSNSNPGNVLSGTTTTSTLTEPSTFDGVGSAGFVDFLRKAFVNITGPVSVGSTTATTLQADAVEDSTNETYQPLAGGLALPYGFELTDTRSPVQRGVAALANYVSTDCRQKIDRALAYVRTKYGTVDYACGAVDGGVNLCSLTDVQIGVSPRSATFGDLQRFFWCQDTAQCQSQQGLTAPPYCSSPPCDSCATLTVSAPVGGCVGWVDTHFNKRAATRDDSAPLATRAISEWAAHNKGLCQGPCAGDADCMHGLKCFSDLPAGVVTPGCVLAQHLDASTAFSVCAPPAGEDLPNFSVVTGVPVLDATREDVWRYAYCSYRHNSSAACHNVPAPTGCSRPPCDVCPVAKEEEPACEYGPLNDTQLVDAECLAEVNRVRLGQDVSYLGNESVWRNVTGVSQNSSTWADVARRLRCHYLSAGTTNNANSVNTQENTNCSKIELFSCSHPPCDTCNASLGMQYAPPEAQCALRNNFLAENATTLVDVVLATPLDLVVTTSPQQAEQNGPRNLHEHAQGQQPSTRRTEINYQENLHRGAVVLLPDTRNAADQHDAQTLQNSKRALDASHTTTQSAAEPWFTCLRKDVGMAEADPSGLYLDVEENAILCNLADLQKGGNDEEDHDHAHGVDQQSTAQPPRRRARALSGYQCWAQTPADESFCEDASQPKFTDQMLCDQEPQCHWGPVGNDEEEDQGHCFAIAASDQAFCEDSGAPHYHDEAMCNSEPQCEYRQDSSNAGDSSSSPAPSGDGGGSCYGRSSMHQQYCESFSHSQADCNNNAQCEYRYTTTDSSSSTEPPATAGGSGSSTPHCFAINPGNTMDQSFCEDPQAAHYHDEAMCNSQTGRCEFRANDGGTTASSSSAPAPPGGAGSCYGIQSIDQTHCDGFSHSESACNSENLCEYRYTTGTASSTQAPHSGGEAHCFAIDGTANPADQTFCEDPQAAHFHDEAMCNSQTGRCEFRASDAGTTASTSSAPTTPSSGSCYGIAAVDQQYCDSFSQSAAECNNHPAQCEFRYAGASTSGPTSSTTTTTTPIPGPQLPDNPHCRCRANPGTSRIECQTFPVRRVEDCAELCYMRSAAVGVSPAQACGGWAASVNVTDTEFASFGKQHNASDQVNVMCSLYRAYNTTALTRFTGKVPSTGPASSSATPSQQQYRRVISGPANCTPPEFAWRGRTGVCDATQAGYFQENTKEVVYMSGFPLMGHVSIPDFLLPDYPEAHHGCENQDCSSTRTFYATKPEDCAFACNLFGGCMRYMVRTASKADFAHDGNVTCSLLGSATTSSEFSLDVFVADKRCYPPSVGWELAYGDFARLHGNNRHDRDVLGVYNLTFAVGLNRLSSAEVESFCSGTDPGRFWADQILDKFGGAIQSPIPEITDGRSSLACPLRSTNYEVMNSSSVVGGQSATDGGQQQEQHHSSESAFLREVEFLRVRHQSIASAQKFLIAGGTTSTTTTSHWPCVLRRGALEPRRHTWPGIVPSYFWTLFLSPFGLNATLDHDETGSTSATPTSSSPSPTQTSSTSSSAEDRDSQLYRNISKSFELCRPRMAAPFCERVRIGDSPGKSVKTVYLPDSFAATSCDPSQVFDAVYGPEQPASGTWALNQYGRYLTVNRTDRTNGWSQHYSVQCCYPTHWSSTTPNETLHTEQVPGQHLYRAVLDSFAQDTVYADQRVTPTTTNADLLGTTPKLPAKLTWKFGVQIYNGVRKAMFTLRLAEIKAYAYDNPEEEIPLVFTEARPSLLYNQGDYAVDSNQQSSAEVPPTFGYMEEDGIFLEYRGELSYHGQLLGSLVLLFSELPVNVKVRVFDALNRPADLMGQTSSPSTYQATGPFFPEKAFTSSWPSTSISGQRVPHTDAYLRRLADGKNAQYVELSLKLRARSVPAQIFFLKAVAGGGTEPLLAVRLREASMELVDPSSGAVLEPSSLLEDEENQNAGMNYKLNFYEFTEFYFLFTTTTDEDDGGGSSTSSTTGGSTTKAKFQIGRGKSAVFTRTHIVSKAYELNDLDLQSTALLFEVASVAVRLDDPEPCCEPWFANHVLYEGLYHERDATTVLHDPFTQKRWQYDGCADEARWHASDRWYFRDTYFHLPLYARACGIGFPRDAYHLMRNFREHNLVHLDYDVVTSDPWAGTVSESFETRVLDTQSGTVFEGPAASLNLTNYLENVDATSGVTLVTLGNQGKWNDPSANSPFRVSVSVPQDMLNLQRPQESNYKSTFRLTYNTSNYGDGWQTVERGDFLGYVLAAALKRALQDAANFTAAQHFLSAVKASLYNDSLAAGQFLPSAEKQLASITHERSVYYDPQGTTCLHDCLHRYETTVEEQLYGGYSKPTFPYTVGNHTAHNRAEFFRYCLPEVANLNENLTLATVPPQFEMDSQNSTLRGLCCQNGYLAEVMQCFRRRCDPAGDAFFNRGNPNRYPYSAPYDSLWRRASTRTFEDRDLERSFSAYHAIERGCDITYQDLRETSNVTLLAASGGQGMTGVVKIRVSRVLAENRLLNVQVNGATEIFTQGHLDFMRLSIWDTLVKKYPAWYDDGVFDVRVDNPLNHVELGLEYGGASETSDQNGFSETVLDYNLKTLILGRLPSQAAAQLKIDYATNEHGFHLRSEWSSLGCFLSEVVENWLAPPAGAAAASSGPRQRTLQARVLTQQAEETGAEDVSAENACALACANFRYFALRGSSTCVCGDAFGSAFAGSASVLSVNHTECACRAPQHTPATDSSASCLYRTGFGADQGALRWNFTFPQSSAGYSTLYHTAQSRQLFVPRTTDTSCLQEQCSAELWHGFARLGIGDIQGHGGRIYNFSAYAGGVTLLDTSQRALFDHPDLFQFFDQASAFPLSYHSEGSSAMSTALGTVMSPDHFFRNLDVCLNVTNTTAPVRFENCCPLLSAYSGCVLAKCRPNATWRYGYDTTTFDAEAQETTPGVGAVTWPAIWPGIARQCQFSTPENMTKLQNHTYLGFRERFGFFPPRVDVDVSRRSREEYRRIFTGLFAQELLESNQLQLWQSVYVKNVGVTAYARPVSGLSYNQNGTATGSAPLTAEYLLVDARTFARDPGEFVVDGAEGDEMAQHGMRCDGGAFPGVQLEPLSELECALPAVRNFADRAIPELVPESGVSVTSPTMTLFRVKHFACESWSLELISDAEHCIGEASAAKSWASSNNLQVVGGRGVTETDPRNPRGCYWDEEGEQFRYNLAPRTPYDFRLTTPQKWVLCSSSSSPGDKTWPTAVTDDGSPMPANPQDYRPQGCLVTHHQDTVTMWYNQFVGNAPQNSMRPSFPEWVICRVKNDQFLQQVVDVGSDGSVNELPRQALTVSKDYGAVTLNRTRFGSHGRSDAAWNLTVEWYYGPFREPFSPTAQEALNVLASDRAALLSRLSSATTSTSSSSNNNPEVYKDFLPYTAQSNSGACFAPNFVSRAETWVTSLSDEVLVQVLRGDAEVPSLTTCEQRCSEQHRCRYLSYFNENDEAPAGTTTTGGATLWLAPGPLCLLWARCNSTALFRESPADLMVTRRKHSAVVPLPRNATIFSDSPSSGASTRKAWFTLNTEDQETQEIFLWRELVPEDTWVVPTTSTSTTTTTTQPYHCLLVHCLYSTSPDAVDWVQVFPEFSNHYTESVTYTGFYERRWHLDEDDASSSSSSTTLMPPGGAPASGAPPRRELGLPTTTTSAPPPANLELLSLQDAKVESFSRCLFPSIRPECCEAARQVAVCYAKAQPSPCLGGPNADLEFNTTSFMSTCATTTSTSTTTTTQPYDCLLQHCLYSNTIDWPQLYPNFNNDYEESPLYAGYYERKFSTTTTHVPGTTPDPASSTSDGPPRLLYEDSSSSSPPPVGGIGMTSTMGPPPSYLLRFEDAQVESFSRCLFPSIRPECCEAARQVAVCYAAASPSPCVGNTDREFNTTSLLSTCATTTTTTTSTSTTTKPHECLIVHCLHSGSINWRQVYPDFSNQFEQSDTYAGYFTRLDAIATTTVPPASAGTTNPPDLTTSAPPSSSPAAPGGIAGGTNTNSPTTTTWGPPSHLVNYGDAIVESFERCLFPSIRAECCEAARQVAVCYADASPSPCAGNSDLEFNTTSLLTTCATTTSTTTTTTKAFDCLLQHCLASNAVDWLQVYPSFSSEYGEDGAFAGYYYRKFDTTTTPSPESSSITTPDPYSTTPDPLAKSGPRMLGLPSHLLSLADATVESFSRCLFPSIRPDCCEAARQVAVCYATASPSPCMGNSDREFNTTSLMTTCATTTSTSTTSTSTTTKAFDCLLVHCLYSNAVDWVSVYPSFGTEYEEDAAFPGYYERKFSTSTTKPDSTSTPDPKAAPDSTSTPDPKAAPDSGSSSSAPDPYSGTSSPDPATSTPDPKAAPDAGSSTPDPYAPPPDGGGGPRSLYEDQSSSSSPPLSTGPPTTATTSIGPPGHLLSFQDAKVQSFSRCLFPSIRPECCEAARHVAVCYASASPSPCMGNVDREFNTTSLMTTCATTTTTTTTTLFNACTISSKNPCGASLPLQPAHQCSPALGTERLYTCACAPGHEAVETAYNVDTHGTGYAFVPGSTYTTCIDVDECAVSDGSSPPCGPAADQNVCTNLVGAYRCACGPGYERLRDGATQGELCVRVNECDHNPCGAAGFSVRSQTQLTHTCDQTAQPGNWRCTCASGYQSSGGDFPHCEEIDECDAVPNPCGPSPPNRCYDLVDHYMCQCEGGFELQWQQANNAAVRVLERSPKMSMNTAPFHFDEQKKDTHDLQSKKHKKRPDLQTGTRPPKSRDARRLARRLQAFERRQHARRKTSSPGAHFARRSPSHLTTSTRGRSDSPRSRFGLPLLEDAFQRSSNRPRALTPSATDSCDDPNYYDPLFPGPPYVGCEAAWKGLPCDRLQEFLGVSHGYTSAHQTALQRRCHSTCCEVPEYANNTAHRCGEQFPTCPYTPPAGVSAMGQKTYFHGCANGFLDGWYCMDGVAYRRMTLDGGGYTRNYRGAQLACEDLGASLAMARTANQVELLSQLGKQEFPGDPPPDGVHDGLWLGLRAAAVGNDLGEWMWELTQSPARRYAGDVSADPLPGAVAGGAAWAPGEPVAYWSPSEASLAKRCAAWRPSDEKWHTFDCEATWLPFVCSIEYDPYVQDTLEDGQMMFPPQQPAPTPYRMALVSYANVDQCVANSNNFPMQNVDPADPPQLLELLHFPTACLRWDELFYWKISGCSGGSLPADESPTQLDNGSSSGQILIEEFFWDAACTDKVSNRLGSLWRRMAYCKKLGSYFGYEQLAAPADTRFATHLCSEATTRKQHDEAITASVLPPEGSYPTASAPTCGCPRGYERSGASCVGIDDCVGRPCGDLVPASACTDQVEGHVCSCPDGFRNDQVFDEALQRQNQTCVSNDGCASKGDAQCRTSESPENRCTDVGTQYRCTCGGGFVKRLALGSLTDEVCVSVEQSCAASCARREMQRESNQFVMQSIAPGKYASAHAMAYDYLGLAQDDALLAGCAAELNSNPEDKNVMRAASGNFGLPVDQNGAATPAVWNRRACCKLYQDFLGCLSSNCGVQTAFSAYFRDYCQVGSVAADSSLLREEVSLTGQVVLEFPSVASRNAFYEASMLMRTGAAQEPEASSAVNAPAAASTRSSSLFLDHLRAELKSRALAELLPGYVDGVELGKSNKVDVWLSAVNRSLTSLATIDEGEYLDLLMNQQAHSHPPRGRRRRKLTSSSTGNVPSTSPPPGAGPSSAAYSSADPPPPSSASTTEQPGAPHQNQGLNLAPQYPTSFDRQITLQYMIGPFSAASLLPPEFQDSETVFAASAATSTMTELFLVTQYGRQDMIRDWCEAQVQRRFIGPETLQELARHGMPVTELQVPGCEPGPSCEDADAVATKYLRGGSASCGCACLGQQGECANRIAVRQVCPVTCATHGATTCVNAHQEQDGRQRALLQQIRGHPSTEALMRIPTSGLPGSSSPARQQMKQETFRQTQPFDLDVAKAASSHSGTAGEDDRAATTLMQLGAQEVRPLSDRALSPTGGAAPPTNPASSTGRLFAPLALAAGQREHQWSLTQLQTSTLSSTTTVSVDRDSIDLSSFLPDPHVYPTGTLNYMTTSTTSTTSTGPPGGGASSDHSSSSGSSSDAVRVYGEYPYLAEARGDAGTTFAGLAQRLRTLETSLATLIQQCVRTALASSSAGQEVEDGTSPQQNEDLEQSLLVKTPAQVLSEAHPGFFAQPWPRDSDWETVLDHFQVATADPDAAAPTLPSVSQSAAFVPEYVLPGCEPLFAFDEREAAAIVSAKLSDLNIQADRLDLSLFDPSCAQRVPGSYQLTLPQTSMCAPLDCANPSMYTPTDPAGLNALVCSPGSSEFSFDGQGCSILLPALLEDEELQPGVVTPSVTLASWTNPLALGLRNRRSLTAGTERTGLIPVPSSSSEAGVPTRGRATDFYIRKLDENQNGNDVSGSSGSGAAASSTTSTSTSSTTTSTIDPALVTQPSQIEYEVGGVKFTSAEAAPYLAHAADGVFTPGLVVQAKIKSCTMPEYAPGKGFGEIRFINGAWENEKFVTGADQMCSVAQPCGAGRFPQLLASSCGTTAASGATCALSCEASTAVSAAGAASLAAGSDAVELKGSSDDVLHLVSSTAVLQQNGGGTQTASTSTTDAEGTGILLTNQYGTVIEHQTTDGGGANPATPRRTIQSVNRICYNGNYYTLPAYDRYVQNRFYPLRRDPLITDVAMQVFPNVFPLCSVADAETQEVYVVQASVQFAVDDSWFSQFSSTETASGSTDLAQLSGGMSTDPGAAATTTTRPPVFLTDSETLPPPEE
ncbi:unnamed protein product, partial [Amoebophrya sp. A120]|eukprot:GSA120T00015046001.1